MVIDKDVITEDEIAKAYGVKKIYISCDTAYVIDANDDLWAWGANEYNKLGQGNSSTYNQFIKVNINGLDLNTTNIIKIEASNYSLAGNAIIICDNGKTYCC